MNEASSGTGKLNNLNGWDNIKVPGLHPSMSMSDLVSHIENRFSEHRTSTNSPCNDERESLEILDEISRCLFTDSQHVPTSDEKSIMTRVDSLYNLLRKDSGPVQDFNFRSTHSKDMSLMDNKTKYQLNSFAPEVKSELTEDSSTPHGELVDLSGKGLGMSRKDSVGELLLNLPRIASLPQFFFNISEDFNSQAR